MEFWDSGNRASRNLRFPELLITMMILDQLGMQASNLGIDDGEITCHAFFGILSFCVVFVCNHERIMFNILELKEKSRILK